MATSTLGSGTLVLAGTTSGTTTVTATAVAGTTTLTLPAATDTLVGKATTDTLTNKTLTGAAMNGTLGATTASTVAATTLTTSSTVTHNGGTANGVPYLNGSKVLTTGSALVFDGTNFSTTGTITGTKFIPTGSSATGNGVYLPAANSVGLSTNGAERFRMNASGSAFFSGNYTVDYPGSGNTSTGIFLESAGQLCVSRDNTVAGRFNRNSSDGILVSFARQGTEVGSVQITTTATSYVTSSDYRLKENIAPMTGALAKVALLKPVTYKWKSNGSDGQGFIAHELQAVVPDCVLGEKDGTQMQPYQITPAIPATYDEDGNELTPTIDAVMGEREVPKYKGIDTSFLVATLTAAIQEQQALITQLTARITALEDK